MDRNELTQTLLAGLIDLEKSGDLVITHPVPTTLADQLCSKLIQSWGTEFLDEPPNEVVIEDGIQASAIRFQKLFNVEHAHALATVEAFVHSLAASRTPKELAELISHQGIHEIADGAYYCIHLKRGAYYGRDYLDWRRDHYEQMRQQS